MNSIYSGEVFPDTVYANAGFITKSILECLTQMQMKSVVADVV